MEYFEYFIHIVCLLAFIQHSTLLYTRTLTQYISLVWWPYLFGRWHPSFAPRTLQEERKPKTACYSSLYIYNAESATMAIITQLKRSRANIKNSLEKFCAFNWKFTTSLILVGVCTLWNKRNLTPIEIQHNLQSRCSVCNLYWMPHVLLQYTRKTHIWMIEILSIFRFHSHLCYTRWVREHFFLFTSKKSTCTTHIRHVYQIDRVTSFMAWPFVPRSTNKLWMHKRVVTLPILWAVKQTARKFMSIIFIWICRKRRLTKNKKPLRFCLLLSNRLCWAPHLSQYRQQKQWILARLAPQTNSNIYKCVKRTVKKHESQQFILPFKSVFPPSPSQFDWHSCLVK